jgi:molecular chaperone Hsp33
VEPDADGWNRACMLAGTVEDQELVDPLLAPERLLYRLFHEDGVRVFRERPLEAQCRCSREKVARVLASLPPAEVEDLKDDGVVVVTCQFCSAAYRFDDDDLARLYGT